MKLVELKEFTVRSEAELALNLLLENGINAVLQGDDMGGLNPSLGVVNGYQLLVKADEETAARELIG